jgi:signal transduction histidine kinase
MYMEQRHTPQLIFTSALVLLLFSGMFSGWAIYRLYQGDQWVHHTYDVELTLASIESDLSTAGRSRTKFFESSDPHYLETFAQARTEALADLARVRILVADSQDQMARSYRLESAINGRLAAIEKGIDLAKTHPADTLAQTNLTALLTESAIQTSAVSDEMSRAEDILLQQRSRITGRRFDLIAAALACMFLLAVFLIWEHYRRLAGELKRRVLAEQNARNLNTQVLRVQDDERRRISRELHDGLGQNLIAAKMIADSFTTKPPTEDLIAQLSSILETTVSSVRSMSYLLYPPLLDEIGLASAAEWLIDGLSKRSNIVVRLEIGGVKRRLPPGVEVALFRILQESLANIQRHARTLKADIVLKFEFDRVVLRIRDHGIGMSTEKLRELEERASYAGIGLAGMKQRAQEQGGTFRLSSSPGGTTIEVEIPAVSETPIVEGISA